MDQPKFKVGQKVKFAQDNDSEAGVVQSFSFHPETGYLYTISARELDFQAKQIIEGIKHCREEELVDMEGKEASSKQPTQPTKTVDVTDEVNKAA